MRIKLPRLASLLLMASAATMACATAATAAATADQPATPHSIAFDQYSFLVDGQRVYLWSGEFHPYRLPSPELWRDIFQKMKAAGFNTTSIYFSWGYHSPREGAYDFTGIRDMDRVLDEAQKAGIYVIARPGPYINAEVDSGGFPLWLTQRPVKNRSADPEYLKLGDEWLSQIDKIIARHQLSDGRGSVIAYQIENEFYTGDDKGRDYIQHLKDKAKADGITVPLVGNHNDTFVSGKGAMDVTGWDYYPQGFDCSHPEQWKPAPDMAAHRHAGQPLFTAEFQGGAFDPWGGPGYAQCAKLINDRFANVFYKENIAAGATAQNFYMLYGGTSWGWQAIPQNYTSYDYGAAITEARQFEPKYYEDKRIGYLVTGLPALLKTDDLKPRAPDNPRLVEIARINPETGTQFHLLRHGDTTASTGESTHIALSLKEGAFPRIPQQPGTAIRIDGRESKLLVADAKIGTATLVYSTSELMTQAGIGARDVGVLYGRAGSDGETVLAFKAKPQVKVLEGQATTTWSKGLLRLNYQHHGLLRLLIEGGECPLLLLIGENSATDRIWRQDTAQGPVLLLGAHLLRSAHAEGDTLALTGDGDADPHAEVLAGDAQRVTWNGAAVSPAPTASGTLAFDLPIPRPLVLPALDHWTSREDQPETSPTFNDKTWKQADLTISSSVTKPGSLPVLFADDYGFHTGNTWYRGHFSGKAGAAPSGIRLQVKSGGPAGAFSVWLNGHFLGSVTRNESGAFSFPAALVLPGDNVVSVLTVNMGHEEDYNSTGESRTARGIVAAVPLGARADAIRWRLQGAVTGHDKLRGPYNLGGLNGERAGWPTSQDTAGWTSASLPAATASPGVRWYRSDVALDLPQGQDTSLSLAIKDPPGRHYRALIFVNGWQLGHYISDMGPQSRFPIPAGLLDGHGVNHIAIAVWKVDDTPGGLGVVSLVDEGSFTAPDPAR
jgi:beta-galactosidase